MKLWACSDSGSLGGLKSSDRSIANVRESWHTGMSGAGSTNLDNFGPLKIVISITLGVVRAKRQIIRRSSSGSLGKSVKDLVLSVTGEEYVAEVLLSERKTKTACGGSISGP